MAISSTEEVVEKLKNYTNGFAPVVPFNASADGLLLMDFTERNKELTEEILRDTDLFSTYVMEQLEKGNAKYGIGGYGEHRTIYGRSELFSTATSSSPSPTTTPYVVAGAKALSRWEEDDDPAPTLEEDTIGYRYADSGLYGLLKEYAVQHRGQPSEAEGVLWKALKTKRFEGFKFQRQHIIDTSIADFICLQRKLIIEIDGLIHSLPDHQLGDEQRTDRLQTVGFKVIRFTNEQVLHDIEKTLQTIASTLKNQPEIESRPDLSRWLSGSPTGRQGAARRLHLGVDIWGPAHVPVYAPLQATVHSFAFNSAFGDYGATLILQHEIEGSIFHTLYGHLSLKSIEDKRAGQTIEKGGWIATFGEPAENGHWPPHLHFQIINDLQGGIGDYPGVCVYAEREKYLDNCPDGDLMLGMMKYAR